MAGEEGGLEKAVNQEAPKPQGGGIFNSIGSSIDSLVSGVKAIPKAVSKAAHYTYYTAKAAAGLAAGVALANISPLMAGAAIQTYTSLILPVGMAIGAWVSNLRSKSKTTFKQMANELAIGGILGGTLHHLFAGVKYAGDAVKASYGAAAGLLTKGAGAVAQMPIFLGVHEYLNRFMMSDYKPQKLDMGKKLKKMWPILPVILANFTVVPEYLGHNYQMPVAAGISVAYGALKGEKKEEKKEAPQQPDMNQLMQQYQNQQRKAA